MNLIATQHTHLFAVLKSLIFSFSRFNSEYPTFSNWNQQTEVTHMWNVKKVAQHFAIKKW